MRCVRKCASVLGDLFFSLVFYLSRAFSSEFLFFSLILFISMGLCPQHGSAMANTLIRSSAGIRRSCPQLEKVNSVFRL